MPTTIEDLIDQWRLHPSPEVGSCANQLAGWLRTQITPEDAQLRALVAQMDKYAEHEILYRDLAVGQRIQEWVTEFNALLPAS